MARPIYAYIRVSSKGQSAYGTGLDRQEACIREFCTVNGLGEPAAWFRDEMTGTSDAEARPGLAAMFKELANQSGALVLVEHADRLARDLIVSETIIARFAELSAEVVAASSGVKLTDATNETTVFIRQVLGAVAQLNKSLMIARTRAAQLKMRERDGRFPQGRRKVRLDDRTPEQQRILGLIARLRARGRPLDRIAAVLNRAGVPTLGASQIQLLPIRGKPRGGWYKQLVSMALRCDGMPERSRSARVRSSSGEVERDAAEGVVICGDQP